MGFQKVEFEFPDEKEEKDIEIEDSSAVEIDLSGKKKADDYKESEPEVEAKEELEIELKDENFDHKWTIARTNNTPSMRIQWFNEQTEACKDAGFTVNSLTDNHLLMEQQIK